MYNKEAEIIQLLGVGINNITMANAIDRIIQMAKEMQPTQVAFVNADCLNIAFIHDNYTDILNQLSLVLPDGIGVNIAARIQGMRIKANVNGTDLFPLLAQRMEEEKLSVYLLGARLHVLETMVRNLRQNYPGLLITGHHCGYFEESEEQTVIKKIASSNTNVLLTAFGVPKQELWINEHLTSLNIGVAIGVGGLFDFIGERNKRAPRWIRKNGMEWLFRMIQEPNRLWKRYLLGNPLFLWRACILRRKVE